MAPDNSQKSIHASRFIVGAKQVGAARKLHNKHVSDLLRPPPR